jgi:hypothetical protein
MRNEYGTVVGKPEGESPLAGHRFTWEDSIKTNL